MNYKIDYSAFWHCYHDLNKWLTSQITNNSFKLARNVVAFMLM